MELAEIAASVAKALGLERVEPKEWQVAHWRADIFHSLLADGSNLFDPYWQARCRDWLHSQGYYVTTHTNGGWIDRALGGVQEWSENCPPSEFCARAIHALNP